MRLNKLLAALGNINQIAEGIKNRIFKNEDIEAVAKMRWQECKMCPLLDKVGKSCAVNGTQPCCSDCGCSISLKIRSMSSDCPKGRWEAIMTPELEDKLKKQVYFGHEAKQEHEKKLNKLRKEQKIRLEKAKAKRDGRNI
tara:strand:+ start:2039 stop:2458 length:420 start_codon:yes stop_codon:yes gene_type:complete